MMVMNNEIIGKTFNNSTNTYHFRVLKNSNFEELGLEHPTLKQILMDVIAKEFELKKRVNIYIKRVDK